MKINKAYRFRLKISKAIEQQLLFFAGCCRKAWNLVLEICLRRRANDHKIMWFHEADFWVKIWKKSEEYGFLKKCHSQLLQQKLMDLDEAFRDAFDPKQKNKHLPTWRKSGQHDSFRYPQGFKLNNRRIYLPKIGWVGFHKSQEIIGTPKSVTVSREHNNWYISISVEVEVDPLIHPSRSAVGIDLGVESFAALSNGTHIPAIHALEKQASKLAKSQRQLAKKKRFSANWKKQKKKVQQIHRKIAAARYDFLQKLSTQLSNNHAMIVVEDLKIANMSRSAKGTLEQPGKNVKAKSGLNKAILDQGWGIFKKLLRYKQKWSGGVLLEVSPRFTSQCCNECGYIAKENRPTQACFDCQRCGHLDNADTNAAKNILAAGHAVLACGEAALAASLKQELLGKGNLVPA